MSFLIRKCLCTAIKFLYYESVLNLMHDTDERNAPINILNLFSRTSNSHYYSTRSSTQNVYVKKSRLDIRKNAFSCVGANGCGMRCQIALKTYQERPSEKNLIGALLNTLKIEDNYIANDKIMARLKKC